MTIYLFSPRAYLFRLDGKHTVFGSLVGNKQILNELEYCGSPSGQPRKRVVITDCGEVKEEAK